jgi:hypothetical protein
MRVEVAQAKRQAAHFAAGVEKGTNLRRLEETVLRKGGLWDKYQRMQHQRHVVDATEAGNNQELMQMIFTE